DHDHEPTPLMYTRKDRCDHAICDLLFSIDAEGGESKSRIERKPQDLRKSLILEPQRSCVGMLRACLPLSKHRDFCLMCSRSPSSRRSWQSVTNPPTRLRCSFPAPRKTKSQDLGKSLALDLQRSYVGTRHVCIPLSEA